MNGHVHPPRETMNEYNGLYLELVSARGVTVSKKA